MGPPLPVPGHIEHQEADACEMVLGVSWNPWGTVGHMYACVCAPVCVKGLKQGDALWLALGHQGNLPELNPSWRRPGIRTLQGP